MQKLNNDWDYYLDDEFDKPYFVRLQNLISEQRKTHTVYPKEENIYKALIKTPLSRVKVVIIGQDPYHEPNQAHGLCFSVQDGVALPPSLKNIYKEIENEFGIKMSNSGNLEKWAEQGVLLLNSSLTVNEGMAGSHRSFGWEQFTQKIIEIINNKQCEVVFLLWGKHAQEYEKYINLDKHFVLKCAHPSPLSAYNGFFGCNHFKKCNEILKALGKEPIDWKI